MSDGGVHIHRPIPRRPFDLLRSPTPPDDDNDYSPPSSPRRPYSLDDDQTRDNYLDPRAFNAPIDSTSRAQSYQFLTSSTLSGIHSPNLAGGFDDDDVSAAVTPAPTPTQGKLDDSIYKLMRDRSSVMARRRSSTMSGKSGQACQHASSTSLVLRTGLLFLLGIGYGALLLRLSTEKQWTSFPVDEILWTGHDAKYMTAWGLYGVVLGSLLPWFDGKWEEMFESSYDADEEAINDDDTPGTDWALVMRGIGAFAGIVFAIVRSHPHPPPCPRGKKKRKRKKKGTWTNPIHSAKSRGPRPCKSP